MRVYVSGNFFFPSKYTCLYDLYIVLIYYTVQEEKPQMPLGPGGNNYLSKTRLKVIHKTTFRAVYLLSFEFVTPNQNMIRH